MYIKIFIRMELNNLCSSYDVVNSKCQLPVHTAVSSNRHARTVYIYVNTVFHFFIRKKNENPRS